MYMEGLRSTDGKHYYCFRICFPVSFQGLLCVALCSRLQVPRGGDCLLFPVSLVPRLEEVTAGNNPLPEPRSREVGTEGGKQMTTEKQPLSRPGGSDEH